MFIRNIYRNYFKNNLFMRIILFFSIITIVTIITFSYLMFKFMSELAVERQMGIQKRAIESVGNYIGNKYGAVQDMVRGLYRDEELANNITYFLQYPYQDYVKYRLDRFYSSTTDPVAYFRNQVEDDADIRSLMLYSAEQQQLFVYNDNFQFKVISTNAARSFIPDVMYQQENADVADANIWVRQAVGLSDQPMYSIRIPVNDKLWLRNIGQLMVFFNTDGVWKSLAPYQEDLKGTILVLAKDGEVLFDSSGEYYGQKYPYADQIDNTLFSDGLLNETTTITKLTQNQAGFTVVSVVPQQELAKTYRGLRNTIVTVSIICIFFATLIPSLFISNFAKRTYGIIRFTRKVRSGDLKARIADSREDELGQISKSFNDMLDELNIYIDRVLKAEIKQRRTEQAALEARVNPHFLYNTLEVIRMRAISQGAADVGEMIYSLSMLFKSYVQQKARYTLKDELEACRLYLELFRIRYKDKFAYEISCEKEIENSLVLKMSLQPIIENYILHGMRPERTDNRIEIRVERLREGVLRAVVKDNGKGIESERLGQINAALQNPEIVSDSFGMRSIHDRLKLLYGPDYGLEVQSEIGQGTTVAVSFPELWEEETSHV